VTDLEELALRRDRGYLVRLVLFLVLSLGAGAVIMRWLTGANTIGCATDAFLGQDGRGRGGAPAVEPLPPR
jgi:uncharacterized membrane protein YjdF